MSTTPGPTESRAIVERLEADLVDIQAAAGKAPAIPRTLHDVPRDARGDAPEPPD